jgi:hypothetical protein
LSVDGRRCDAPAAVFAMGQHRCLVHDPKGAVSCSHSLAPTGRCSFCGALTDPSVGVVLGESDARLVEKVTNLGANGLPLWQSYIAGLNPSDPASQLRLAGTATPDGRACVLHWTPVPDRLYTILSGPTPLGPLAPLPDATDLPATITSYTNLADSLPAQHFYRIAVRKP